MPYLPAPFKYRKRGSMVPLLTLLIGILTSIAVVVVFCMLYEVTKPKEVEGFGLLMLIASFIVPISLSDHLLSPKSFEDNTGWGILLGYVILIVFAYFRQYQRSKRVSEESS